MSCGPLFCSRCSGACCYFEAKTTLTCFCNILCCLYIWFFVQVERKEHFEEHTFYFITNWCVYSISLNNKTLGIIPQTQPGKACFQRHVMFNHCSINHSINFRGLDHRASEKLHVWSPGTAIETHETWKHFITLAVLEIVCLPINPGIDGKKERVRGMPDDTSSSVAWAGEQHRSSKNFHHAQSKSMHNTWPKSS